MDHRNDRFSFDAPENPDTMAEVLQQVALKDGSERLAFDQETHGQLEDALEPARARKHARAGRFRGGTSTPVCAVATTTTSCNRSTGCALVYGSMSKYQMNNRNLLVAYQSLSPIGPA
jgi:hypothetical protein